MATMTVRGNTFEKGEIIFYEAQDKTFSLYKVQTVMGGDKYHLAQIGFTGKVEPKGKKFDSTLRGMKGNIRLHRIWIQPEDKVFVKEGNEIGTVEMLYVESPKKDVFHNMVNIIGDKTRTQYTYQINEAISKVDFV